MEIIMFRNRYVFAIAHFRRVLAYFLRFMADFQPVLAHISVLLAHFSTVMAILTYYSNSKKRKGYSHPFPMFI